MNIYIKTSIFINLKKKATTILTKKLKIFYIILFHFILSITTINWLKKNLKIYLLKLPPTHSGVSRFNYLRIQVDILIKYRRRTK